MECDQAIVDRLFALSESASELSKLISEYVKALEQINNS